jgi:arylsulfatase A-like enzyme
VYSRAADRARTGRGSWIAARDNARNGLLEARKLAEPVSNADGTRRLALKTGPSLVPLLANPNAEWPHASITYLGEPGSYGLSTDDWRLIRYVNGDEELYDSRADRHEWHNLAAKPEHAERLKELRKLAPNEFAPLVAASDESLSKLAWHAAADGAAPASTPDGDPFDVVFINRHGQTVKLFWMDRQAAPKPYGEIAAGERKRQQTRPGAVWLITDESDKPLGHFVVEDRTAQAVIQPQEIQP